MAVTTTTRLGITRWSTGGDAFTRTQMDTSHSNLESRVPIYLHDTFSNRPAAGTVARFFFATDTYRLYYDDGVAWRDVNATYTGAVIAGAYGGTGVANTGKTITVSGNTSIGSGTDTVTFTTSGATSVALPTSGTLITNGVTALNSLIDVDTSNTATHSLSLGTGATVNAATKTVNIGTGGVAGSLTNITLGSSAGTNTITLNGTVSLGYTGDTATTATHYFVETGTDGYIRPKTLANVRTEIVTTSAVNSAAATTVGTITSGTWNGTAIDGQRGGTGVANTGKTITVSGNTVIGSNTDTVTFVTSGATSVTLPTSGTLVNSGVTSLSSLATVGTITSGTWNGSVIDGQRGGTGVANTGKTITVSGNTTIGSSTHTVAFATSDNTSVTLPTSGTLVNSAVTALTDLNTIDSTDTSTHTLTMGGGATASGQTKTINIGRNGVSGSTVNITIGSSAATTKTINLHGLVSLSDTAETATAATHYFVETGSDGYVRPKTLANVKTEIVTTAAVNSAAATTVGTIGNGTWQGTAVAGQYGGTGVANTGKTITVSGNTVIGSNTDTVTFVTSGATSVTLPTSGTLLNGSSTLTASNLSGTIPSAVLGNSTLYIGTTSVALNRGSAAQSLTGISTITLASPSSANSIHVGQTDTVTDGSVFINNDAHSLMYMVANGSGNVNFFRAYKAHGTSGSRTVPTAGASIMQIDARGWGGTAFRGAAAIDFELASGTFSDTSMPGRIRLSTTPDGSTTRSTRLQIDPDGRVDMPYVVADSAASTTVVSKAYVDDARLMAIMGAM